MSSGQRLLVARRSGRNTFIVQSAKSRLNFLLNFIFVLHDMKLNKVQFPQFVERKKFSSTFFKRWQVSSGQRLLVAMSRL